MDKNVKCEYNIDFILYSLTFAAQISTEKFHALDIMYSE